MGTKVVASRAVTNGGRPISQLLEQYGCGPVQFAGGESALYERHILFDNAIDLETATPRDRFEAAARSVRDVLAQRWVLTEKTYQRKNAKRLYYFSLEFLMGRLFSNSLYSAGVFDEMEHALQELGFDTEVLRREEYDMGLGNGGLGRLAACFLDSLATLDLPAIGYGIHYQYGLFKQEFRHGHQVELPDAWQKFGTPWEIVRPEHAVEIPIFGTGRLRGSRAREECERDDLEGALPERQDG